MIEQTNIEEVARAALQTLLHSELATDVPATPTERNPAGLLQSMDSWGSSYPAEANGLTHVVLGACADPLQLAPFGALFEAIVEAVLAWDELEAGLDRFLTPRLPRIASGASGTSRWALLTPVTDAAALLRELLGPVAPRPHHRAAPPSVEVHLHEAHDAVRLRESCGLTLRGALNLEALPAQSQVATIFTPFMDEFAAQAPELAAGLNWLAAQSPEALLAMPLAQAIIDALQGTTAPRDELTMQFVHLLEVPKVGYCALIVWDPAVSLSARQRSALAGYVRKLCDEAIAPWNRWTQPRARREAFLIWGRHFVDSALDADGLADGLRSAYPAEYDTEPRAKTIRRLYRISAALGAVDLPPLLTAAVRSELVATHAAKFERDC